MRHVCTAAIAVAVLGIPLTAASEYTDTAFYDVPAGPVHLVADDATVRPFVSTRPCAAEWEDWDEGLFSNQMDEEDVVEEADDIDDAVGTNVLSPAFATACSTGREARFGDPDSDNGVVNMGIYSQAIRAPADDHSVFTATAHDHLFDAPFFTMCVITYDSRCDDEVDARAEPGDSDTPDFQTSGCGSNTIDTGDVLAGRDNPVMIALYGAHLDAADLEPCFGSAGHLTIVMT